MDWIIPCNEKIYNHRAAFDNLEFIDWKQSTNVKAGDTVYIYVEGATNALLYKCYVKEADLSAPSNNDSDYRLSDNPVDPEGRYMRLVLLCRYPKGQFPKDVLLKNGLSTIQEPSKMNEQLRNYILAHESDSPYITGEVLVGIATLSCEFRRKDGDHEKHDCSISFNLLNHLMWRDVMDSVCFEIAKAATKKLNTYHNPEDFVAGNIYYKEKGDPAIAMIIERKNHEWVFAMSKSIKCKEKTSFYADGRKEVELIRSNED